MAYNKEFIDFLEIVYGEGMLSPGRNILKEMFEGIDLERKNILDIGCGIGGVDFYLAENNKCKILGIDTEPLVIKIAKEKLKKLSLKGEVIFKLYNKVSEIKDNRFNLVFSKESILHIKDKKKLLQEVYTIIEENGQIVLVDWCHKTSIYSKLLLEFIKFDNLEMHLITPKEYLRILEDTGFKDIEYEDMTDKICQETIEVLHRVKTSFSKKLKEMYGEKNYYDYCIPSWEMQIEVLKNKEIQVGKFIAKK